MSVIAVYSLKGGVGKTSFAVNLAWASAQISKRSTLLWDLDPQWAASFLLGHEPAAKGSAHRLFADTAKSEDLILWTGIEKYDLLPADNSLRNLDRYFAQLGKKKRVARLTEELDKAYDRIILDCPPGLTETSDQMMRAADLIIVPVIPSPLSTRALDEVQAHLLARHGGHVPILPVFSMVDRRRTMHREALAANPKWPVVPMASAVERMGAERAPIGSFARNSPAATAYEQLWRGIERKITKLAR
jgi:chromosome partitioning protein